MQGVVTLTLMGRIFSFSDAARPTVDPLTSYLSTTETPGRGSFEETHTSQGSSQQHDVATRVNDRSTTPDHALMQRVLI